MDEVMVECQGGSHDDGLLKSISKAMSVVVRLTREVVDSEGPDSLEITATGTKSITEPGHDAQQASTLEGPFSSQESQPESITTSQEPPDSIDRPRGPKRRALGSSPLYSRSAVSASRTTITPQTFGNGWCHCIEDAPNTASSVPEARIRALPPQNFMLRLVEEILANSYAHLLEDPTGAEPRRVFRYTFNFKTPESLLYCIRWLLGPGRGCIYRTFDIPANLFAKRLSSGRPVGCIEKDENTIGNPEEYIDNFPAEPGVPQFLCAAEIVRKLQSLNCRFLDGDAIEITVPQNHTPCPSTVFEPNTEDLFGVISPFHHQIGKRWVTMRLSTPLLLKNLRSQSVCLIKGPGFPEDLLPKMIEASVTIVNEAPLFMQPV